MRVVSTDRNAPASVVVSIQERPDVRAITENVLPADVSQSFPAPSSVETAVIRPVSVAASPVAAAEAPVKVSATFMPVRPVAKAKPTARSRTGSRNLAQRYPAHHRTLVAREEASAALAYGEAPRHRVDSYPWADAGFR